MIESPLVLTTVFSIGPVPVTKPVVTTWGIMAALTLSAWASTRRLSLEPKRWQTVLEIVLTTIEQQIAECAQGHGRRYLAFGATLFIFLATANLSGLVPGVSPPTAALETDAALTLAVLGATQYYGFAERGFVGYLRGFTRPTPLLLPLHLLAQLTRSFSLMVRLFGNIMSGELIIAIIVSLAALFVPVPLMLLELLIGLLQAYIFTVLATVFIAGAAGGAET